MFRKFMRSTGGAAGFEYAMIAGVIAVAVVAGVTASETGTDETRNNTPAWASGQSR